MAGSGVLSNPGKGRQNFSVVFQDSNNNPKFSSPELNKANNIQPTQAEPDEGL